MQIFSLLESEVKKLPITWSSSHNKPQAQKKWVHALSVVLHALDEYFHWIETMITGPADFDFLIKEVEPRVKQSLAHLVNGGFFSRGDTYTILATLLDYIGSISESYEQLRSKLSWEMVIGPIFKGVVKKYQTIVHNRHRIAPVEPCIAADTMEDSDSDSSALEMTVHLKNCSSIGCAKDIVGAKRKR